MDLLPAQSKRINQIKKRSTTKAVTVTRAQVEALKGEITRITLPQSKTLIFSRRSVEVSSANQFTWTGGLANTGSQAGSLPDSGNQATLVVNDGNITGTIWDEGDLYRVEPVGNGLHAIIKVDPSRFPPEHPPSFEKNQKRAPPPQSTRDRGHVATADAPVGIDVLVAYTPSAESAVGDINATIKVALAEANQSYKNSGVNIKLTLVDSFKFAYSESGMSYEKILADFAANPSVKTKRNNSGADMVVLIINKSDYCGLAKTIGATAVDAFVTVYYDCATGYYSFAHELGHLFGARHDPAHDPSVLPFVYGHGFQYTSGGKAWRTIMAYDCEHGCPRLQYWSNPNVKYNNIAMGSAGTSDNARVLNETAATVAGFSHKATAIGTKSDGTQIHHAKTVPALPGQDIRPQSR
jgi:hypothetical protein